MQSARNMWCRCRKWQWCGEVWRWRCPFTKVPLVVETTGAMGTETQKWWKEIIRMEKDQRGLGESTSRKDLGLDWTFTANGFASYWLQSISMSMARTLAESIVAIIEGNQEADGSQNCPPINAN